MIEKENISVDLITEDKLAEVEEDIQANIEIRTPTFGDIEHVLPTYVISTSTTLGNVYVFYQIEESSHSVNIIDIKTSKRYPITLEEARRRALKSIERAKERKILLGEDY